MRLLVCKGCGHCAMGVSREFAEAEVAKFNAWYVTQPADVQANYAGPSTISFPYECCIRCGGSYKDFRDATSYDSHRCRGGTINPVIEYDSKY